MERVGALIHKLKEQYDQNVDKNALIITAQLLLSELQHEEVGIASREKVSVILPKVHKIMQDVFSVEPEEVKQIQVPVAPLPPEQQKEKPVGLRPPSPESVYNYLHPSAAKEHAAAQKQAAEDKTRKETGETAKKTENKEEPLFGIFDPVQDVPTLTHQKEMYELNDVHIDTGSLNDKLKVEKIELGSSIKEPVKDLKKAIGINDRYRFINELFRGDETEYERSIKTINGLQDLPEAENWIQRELKVKNGWSENNPTVRDFDQMVKRRFS